MQTRGAESSLPTTRVQVVMNLDFNTPCKAVKFDRWDLQENQVHACLAETDKLGHAFTRVDWLCMIRSSQPTHHAQRIWRRFLDPNGLLEQLTMGGSRANLVGGTDYQFDIYRLPFLSSERGVGSSTAQTVYRRSVQVTVSHVLTDVNRRGKLQNDVVHVDRWITVFWKPRSSPRVEL